MTSAQNIGQNGKVWGITCLFNPFQSKARYLNYILFSSRVRAQGLKLITVEQCLEDQQFQLYSDDSDILIQIKNNNKLWQKEALLNLGLKKVPASAEIVCWIDADVILLDNDWVTQVAEMMNGPADVVHLFRSMVYLPRNTSCSLVSDFDKRGHFSHKNISVKSLNLKPIIGSVAIFRETTKGKFINGKWGFGWAIRKSILDNIGGFYDRCVVGGGDTIFFNGVFWGKLHEKFNNRYSTSQEADINEYIHILYDQVEGRVGYLPGMMCHLWHGSFKSRNYFDRYQILKNGNFHPQFDLVRNDGCLQWNTRFFEITLDEEKRLQKKVMIEAVGTYLMNRSCDPDSIEYDNIMRFLEIRLRELRRKRGKSKERQLIV